MNVMRERRLRGAIPTQREVAKILGVRESAVSKWERGIARPRAETVSYTHLTLPTIGG